MIKKCLKCQKEFYVRPCEKDKYKHCSWECRTTNIIKICLTCNKKFKVFPCNAQVKKYCSRKCRKTGSYKKCNFCDKIIYIPKNALKEKNYCSQDCSHKSTIGKKHSEEHKRKIGDAERGAKNWHWKGGKKADKSGYILIYQPNHPFNRGRYVREHRLVIEKQIGHYLTPKEQCHHRNGIKSDNRPKNLMAFSSNSAHKRFERGGKVKKNEIIFDGRNYK